MSKPDNNRPGALAALVRVLIGLTIAALAFAYFYDRVMHQSMSPTVQAQVKNLAYTSAKRLIESLN